MIFNIKITHNNDNPVSTGALPMSNDSLIINERAKVGITGNSIFEWHQQKRFVNS